MTRKNSLYLAVLCLSTVAFAQDQIFSPPRQIQQQVKRYPITGTVYNAVTGAPVNRALVKVQAGGEQLFGFTAGDGRFQIDGVPEGMVNITADRPGYLNDQMGFQHFSRPKVFNVTSGTNDFRVPLQPEARITGTVVDADDEPVEGVQVRVAVNEIAQGRKRQIQRGWANTDESGTYRIDDLPATEAVVQTMPRGVRRGEMLAASTEQVQLVAGQEAHADFKLRSVPAFTVSGVVTGVPAGSGLGIWLEGEDGEPLNVSGGQMFDHATGSFVKRMVPAGSWTLHFVSNDGQGHTTVAELSVTVNADIKGLQVALQPGVNIPVHVNYAAGQEQAQAQMEGPIDGPQPMRVTEVQAQVRLIPLRGRDRMQYFSQNDHIPGVPPGQYHVSAQVFGAVGAQCIDTIASGSIDLLRNPLIVSSGSEPPPIVITTRNDCGTLTVTVHSEKQNLTAAILLFSDQPESEPQLQYLQTSGGTTVLTATTISGPAGTFSGLTPGEYRVYAFSDVDDLEYMNPEALRNFSSQQVTVEPKGKATVTVDLIDRGGQ